MGCGQSSNINEPEKVAVIIPMILNEEEPKKAITDAEIIRMIIDDGYPDSIHPERIVDGCISNECLDQVVKHNQGTFIPIDKVNLNFCDDFDRVLNPNKVKQTLKYLAKINYLPWLRVIFNWVENQGPAFNTAFNNIFQNLTRYNNTFRHLELSFYFNNVLTDQHLGKLGAYIISNVNLKSLSLNLDVCKNISNSGLDEFIKALTTKPGIKELELIALNFSTNAVFTDQHLGQLGAYFISNVNLKSLDLDLSNCKNINNSGFEGLMKDLATKPGIKGLEFIRLNIQDTPLTAEDGLSHLKKVYKAFSHSLKQVDLKCTYELYSKKDLFQPEALSPKQKWFQTYDSYNKIWKLREITKEKENVTEEEKEQSQEKKKKKKKKKENPPTLWQITREDLQKVTNSDKLQKLLYPVTAVKINSIDAQTEKYLKQFKNLIKLWKISDVGGDVEKTLTKVINIMQQTSMKSFYLDIKDNTFSGGHLKQIGKVIEKRGDIKKVFIRIDKSKEINDNDFRNFLESLRKTLSKLEAIRFDCYEASRTLIALSEEEKFRERFKSSLKIYEVEKNEEDISGWGGKRGSMRVIQRKIQLEKKRDW